MPPVPAESRPAGRATWALGLVLLLSIAAAYGRGLGDPFLRWDDDRYVWRNPDVQAVTAANVRAVFTRFYVANYAPVQMLSYMADHAVWGLRPAGFILTDLAIHAAAVLLLFLLLRRLGSSDAAAFLGALLFAVHPVQVETVLWISQRKTLLAMAFSLAAVHLHLRATASRPVRWGGVAAAGALFLVALLSKSVAVVVPVLLLLLDVHRGRRLDAVALLEKVPYAVAAAGAAALALVSQAPGEGGGIATAWPGGSPMATALTMVTVVRDYLASVVWPAGLALAYEPVKRTAVDGAVLGSAIVIAATAALPLAFGKARRREAAVWVGAFFLGLVPVLQIVPLVTLRNDRYLYFPMLGAAGLLATAVDAAGARARRAAVGVAAAAVGALAVAGAARVAVWRDPVALWSDAVVKSPASPDAWFNLGSAWEDAGREQDAKGAYRRCLAIAADPSWRGRADALYNLALLHLRLHEFGDSLSVNAGFQALRPGARDGLLLEGHARYGLGQWRAAARAYALLRLRAPADAESMNFESLALEAAGEPEAAGALLARAVAAGGERGRLLLDRAGLEATVGRPAAALRWLDAALAAGFRDLAALRRDADLDDVRGLPGFRAALERHGLGGGEPARSTPSP